MKIVNLLSIKLTWLRHLMTASLFALTCAQTATAGTPAQSPLFLSAPVRPIMMLNLSRDHQFFFKLYDDYSDLDGDGLADTTYKNDYDYFGYFDSAKCYVYSNNRFEPSGYMIARYCNNGSAVNEWSGNFLNWASMTRMDAVRKILYGGFRSTDTSTLTVLERAMLPNDAHSFAKYYGGADVNKLTPFTQNSGATATMDRGITICNTTEPTSRSVYSQNALGAAGNPLIRVAQGNYMLWASNERWQCRWTGSNGNNAITSGIDAHSSSPATGAKLGTGSAAGEYYARVKVCDSTYLSGATDNEKCKLYGSTYKPTGALQNNADKIQFGLMTGSYGKNKSGGVLRKQVGYIGDEINTNGTFKTPATATSTSIIKTLDLLAIYGYNFSTGVYNDSDAGGDNCPWAIASFTEGRCSNWGNPQAEIYLESLRYLAGLASPIFDVNDSTKISGLNREASWNDPVTSGDSGNYCAPLNVLQFNASTTSYDTDALDAGSTALFGATPNAATKLIGDYEGITGNTYFIGQIGTANNQLCTGKAVSDLALAMGLCPESPRVEGGYNLAGLAYLAHTVGIAENREPVKTYGVALAPAVPKVTINVPGTSGAKQINILPACREQRTTPQSNCALVDFKIINQAETATTATGKLYVNWEDSEQGGDYDQDMWGIINYSITNTTVSITTQVYAQSTGGHLGFGYVLSGTTADGFHVHSGVNGFTYTDPAGTGYLGCGADGSATQCRCRGSGDGDQGACTAGNGLATTQVYTVGSSISKFLQTPLYYAAKWGGYDPDLLTTPEAVAAAEPSTYFYATDPRQLDESLNKAFSDVAATVGASATVAANSTRLDGNTYVYQAKFNSGDWSGEVLAYPINDDGSVDTEAPPVWSTNSTLTRSNVGSRKIYTYDGATATSRSLVRLNSGSWGSLVDLKTALIASDDDATGLKRLAWLMGYASTETGENSLRKRTYILGDIVNSDPAFAGPSSFRFNRLPTEFGSNYYTAYVAAKRGRTSALLVGANDGMVHAFDGDTGRELFAYIPRGVYSKLAGLSAASYSHQYTVDGPVYVSDVYLGGDSTGEGGEWRTLVAGTLGAGGRGVYVLDITDVLTSTSGQPKVILDASAEDSNIPYYRDLGYSYGRPLIVPTANGKWTLVIGNGHNSTYGYARLIAVDMETPANYKVIDTKAQVSATSFDNGLAGVAILPNGVGVASYAYGGDILGNMWKFDLTNTSMGSWKVSYGNTTTPKPLIKVIDSSGVAQPITSAPTLGYNSLKTVGTGANTSDAIMVYFGTGKYYEDTDNSSTQVQSVYGIADSDAYIGLTTTNRTTKLHKKEIATESGGARTLSGDANNSDETPAVDWDTKDGWFLDLVVRNGTPRGERVLAKPLLIYDRLLLPTFIPSVNQCDFGGSGWIMELIGVGDRFVGYSLLGDKANHELEDPIMGDLIPISAGEKVIILGSTLARDDKDSLYHEDELKPGGASGRMSWRQLK